MNTDIRFDFRQAGDVTLHVAEAGPGSGPVVILLHGCPEFWFGWRHQIVALASAGYRVVAPDQRGYNLSDKPKGIAAYDLDRLVADILALADVYTAQQFALVGHDWGAAVAWSLAEHHADRVRRLAILNAPHPALWRHAMDEDPEQRKRSRYVRVFGIPVLPELFIRAGRYSALAAAISESTKPPDGDEVARYREAWSRPGALTAMINWYRAILRRRTYEPPKPGTIRPPTRIIWGVEDRYGSFALAEQSRALCGDGELIAIAGATHWVQHEEPERVNALLAEFLA